MHASVLAPTLVAECIWAIVCAAMQPTLTSAIYLPTAECIQTQSQVLVQVMSGNIIEVDNSNITLNSPIISLVKFENTQRSKQIGCWSKAEFQSTVRWRPLLPSHVWSKVHWKQKEPVFVSTFVNWESSSWNWALLCSHCFFSHPDWEKKEGLLFDLKPSAFQSYRSITCVKEAAFLGFQNMHRSQDWDIWGIFTRRS